MEKVKVMEKVEGKLGRDFVTGKTRKGVAIGTLIIFTPDGKLLGDVGGSVAESAIGLRAGDAVVVEGVVEMVPWVCRKTGAARVSRRMKVSRWDMQVGVTFEEVSNESKVMMFQ